MQDQAPLNRAQRRAAQRKGSKGPALVGVRVRPSLKRPHDQVTGTGELSAEEDEGEMADAQAPVADKPPTDRKAASHHKGAARLDNMRNTLITYYALAGMGVARLDMVDGALIVDSSGDFADAWIAAGKANPQIMRALEILTVAGPYTALILVHAKVATTIMDRHGASPLSLFQRVQMPTDAAQEQTPVSTPPPLPYVPVGAQAPVDAPPAPAPYEEGDLLVFPDEGLPADLDTALRQAASQPGSRPYPELRQEALLAIAQIRRQQNGRVGQPGALGAPVARG